MKPLGDQIKSLYSTPLPSSRSGALYNAFSYPTKISPEAIAVFIATHTKPGQTVLDVFGGSGTTGLATLLCDKPTESMLQMASDLGVSPKWGPRNAELYELSTLGAFVAKTLCAPPDPDEFDKAARQLLQSAEKKVGQLYAAEGLESDTGEIRHAIWSDVLICPHCGQETTYWDAALRWKPLHLSKDYKCKTCRKQVAIESCDRGTELYTDRILKTEVIRKKRVPVRVYGTSAGKNWVRDATIKDLERANAAENIKVPKTAPIREIVWGDLYRSGYHTGITHLHHFYTPRNYIAIATLWDLIGTFPNHLQDALRLLILSYNSTHSTLMTRVVVKKDATDLVLTGAQSGVLYISGLPVEKNVFEGIKRKTNSLRRAFEVVSGSGSTVRVTNASSETLKLQSASIDYVFTDPPFGDYIPYAEINQINELWLGATTERKNEIIVSNAQGKGVQEYGEMMARVFVELYRVLKPGSLATVVFHSAKASIWQALAVAYGSAGLSIRATSVLDKIQSSFKQVVSTVSVKGDPLLLLGKAPASDKKSIETAEGVALSLIETAHTASKAERDPQRLYSRYAAKCLELGLAVHIGAKEFYERVKVPVNN
jgi:16S rRNA G966 N2-methylase RsmD